MLHHDYGFCYVFDHTKFENMEKVKVLSRTKNDVRGDLLHASLLFDVSR